MKLLMVTHYFESHRGGIEIAAGGLAREIARCGIAVTWAATDASPPPAADGIRVVPLSAWNAGERRLGVPFPLPGPRSVVRLFREARDADVVLVHDGLYPTSIAAYAAARAHGKPLMLVQHIGEVPYRSRFLRTVMQAANRIVVRPLMTHADQTVFISESTARQFGGVRFRRPPPLIFNGVDTGIFSPAASPDAVAAARLRFGLSVDMPVALFVGRFVEKKGLAVLERLAGARPDVLFALAGWGPMDPRDWHRPNVRVFSGLGGPSLASLYQAADLLVLPSTGEGFPLVIQEALACGLPVICGAESAVADPVAAKFLIGVQVVPADVEGTAARFAEAIAGQLARGIDADERTARFTLACERYAWPRAAARHVEILRRLCERQTGRTLSPAAPAPTVSPQSGR